MEEIIVKLFIIMILFYLSTVDIRKMTVPNKGTALIFIAGIVLMLTGDKNIYFYLNGFILMSVSSIAIALVSKGLGGGDVKLLSALGASLGAYEALEILALSFVMAGIFIVFIRVMSFRNTRFLHLRSKKEIPFVPFIACSAFLIFTENLLYCL